MAGFLREIRVHRPAPRRGLRWSAGQRARVEPQPPPRAHGLLPPEPGRPASVGTNAAFTGAEDVQDALEFRRIEQMALGQADGRVEISRRPGRQGLASKTQMAPRSTSCAGAGGRRWRSRESSRHPARRRQRRGPPQLRPAVQAGLLQTGRGQDGQVDAGAETVVQDAFRQADFLASGLETGRRGDVADALPGLGGVDRRGGGQHPLAAAGLYPFRLPSPLQPARMSEAPPAPFPRPMVGWTNAARISGRDRRPLHSSRANTSMGQDCRKGVPPSCDSSRCRRPATRSVRRPR